MPRPLRLALGSLALTALALALAPPFGQPDAHRSANRTPPTAAGTVAAIRLVLGADG